MRYTYKILIPISPSKSFTNFTNAKTYCQNEPKCTTIRKFDYTFSTTGPRYDIISHTTPTSGQSAP